MKLVRALTEPFSFPILDEDSAPTNRVVALRAPGHPYVQLSTGPFGPNEVEVRACVSAALAGQKWKSEWDVPDQLGPWRHVGDGRFECDRPKTVGTRLLRLAIIHIESQVVHYITPTMTAHCLPTLPGGGWLQWRDAPRGEDLRLLADAMAGAEDIGDALVRLHKRLETTAQYNPEGFQLGVPVIGEGVGPELVNDAGDLIVPWLGLLLDPPTFLAPESVRCQCRGYAALFGGVLSMLGWNTELWSFHHPEYNQHVVCAVRASDETWSILDVPHHAAKFINLMDYFGKFPVLRVARRAVGVEQPALHAVAGEGETVGDFVGRVVPADPCWNWLRTIRADGQPLALFVGHSLPGWYSLVTLAEETTERGGFYRLDRARTTQVELTVGTGVDPMEPDRSVSELNRRFLKPNANLRGTLSTVDVVRGGIVTIGRK